MIRILAGFVLGALAGILGTLTAAIALAITDDEQERSTPE